ncbi:MAG: hypothetical protein V1650_02045 [Candidatus Omnitrophota bacterium]
MKKQNSVKNYIALKKFCHAQGIDLFGVADIAEIKKDFMLSQEILAKVDKAISLGTRLSRGVLDEIKDAPTRLYFHHYRTLNMFLDQAARIICQKIEKKGFLAIPIPASQIVDWQNQKGHLSHRHVAVLAGLGWIGRSNLLVNEEIGSQFRLATILTDMPLKTDKFLQKNCDTCQICVKMCPAQAIKESPKDFDYAKCLDKLKDFQKQRLVDQYICGVCVSACKGLKKG